MRIQPLVLLSSLAVVLCWSQPVARAQGGLAPGNLEKELVESVPPRLLEYRVPGATVAVVRGGKVELFLSFGVRRAGESSPVSERTVFQAASLSKPVVAYGAHILAEQGELDLDRPLSEYLETPYIADPRLDRITARIVLSHSTGFPNWRPGNWNENPGPLRILFDPGSKFRYSGEGYVYLQRVLERVTGESLDVFLRRSVFEPLGMANSSFIWEEAFEAAFAAPHDLDGIPGEKMRPREPLAAGTLHTSAADYARFLLSLIEPGPGPAPLEPQTIDAMLTRTSTINDQLGWSLGWGIETVEDGDYFWQWGDDGPFKAFAAGSRSREIAVVVFTNGHWGLNVARHIIELVLGPRAFLDFRMVNYRPEER